MAPEELIIWVLTFGIFVLLCIIIRLFWKLHIFEKLLKSNKKSKNGEDQVFVETGTETDENDSKILDKVKECLKINEEHLEIMEVVEKREHFILMKGRLKLVRCSTETKNEWLDVMIKQAKDPKDETQRKLIKLEIDHLCDSLKHPNLLALVRCIEKNGHYSIVTEYPEGGNLLDYVRRIKKNGKFKNQFSKFGYSETRIKHDTPLGKLCTLDLLSITWQILNGMIEMVKHPFYHRQLSLSNIFITSNKTVKIGNFSLTRTNGHNEYYKKNTDWEMLISHRAPETFTDGRFTRQSDVWSFGVLLFEFFSLGEVPYQGQEDILKFVKSGNQLEKPKYCHPEIYELMRECWNLEQFERPTFEKLQKELEKHLEKYAIQILDRLKHRLVAKEI